MSEFDYIGGELAFFQHAQNWKRYWSQAIEKHVVGDVLEVGAGLGANTKLLDSRQRGRWVCLEPDQEMANGLKGTIETIERNPSYEVICGTLDSLGDSEVFDTVLYIDVLEHIEDDFGEISRAVKHLRPGGRLIVLSPAHQALFSPFDASIGHYRRYDKKSLGKVTQPGLVLDEMFYLDSLGMILSLANRLLLRQSMPQLKQILFWDRYVIPVSRVLDLLIRYGIGKTIVGVWQRKASG